MNAAPGSWWLHAGGTPLHARAVVPVDGHGPPLVLVHGVGVSSRYMVPLARQLGIRRFAVYAPDLPGFGRSGKPRRSLDVPGLADALAAWTDAAGLARPVLVANSFGCQVAVDLAARRPGRVLALVLLGPTVDPGSRGLAPQLLRWLANSPYEPPSLAPVVLRDYLDCGLRRVAVTVVHCLRDRIEDKLPRVTEPTLVVRGERDRLVSQEWAERAARLLPDGRLVVIPGRAHTLNFNAPVEVADVVGDFVARMTREGQLNAREP
jgi:2-hydroxy-6-oxonona-2,4-dienedioate hydrolase